MDISQYLSYQLVQMGLISEGESRLDASSVAFLSQQLEHMKTRAWEVLRTPMKARQFIPVSSEADRGAETIAWEVMDEVGQADLLANDGDDIPLVEVNSEKQSRLVKTLAVGYGWSIIDVWRSAKARKPLNPRRAGACRRAVERKLDIIGATGYTVGGVAVEGFINSSLVTPTAPITGNWIGGAVAAGLIEADIAKLTRQIVTDTEDIFRPDTLLLPTAEYALIATTRIAPESGTTILEVILNSNPWIRNIDSWEPLGTAGAGSTTRMVAYMRDPEVLQYEIPLDFFQLPPQARNINFVVPCLSRVSGVEIYHPKAIAYMDGI